MSEKDNKTLIIVAVIGLAGTLGAAFISNFDKFFPIDKKEGSQVEKNQTAPSGEYRGNGEIESNIRNEGENRTYDKKNDVVNFDKSVLIFKNRKFNEGETITFLDGKFSITISNSSEYDCKMRVYQRFSIEKESNYRLVNGSPLPISIGSLKYFFHFNAGEYRKYCVITSYYN